MFTALEGKALVSVKPKAYDNSEKIVGVKRLD